MSFLSILLFASAFYFAQATPVAQTVEAPAVPIKPFDPSVYQEQMSGFMQEMTKAMDKFMTPMISQLDVKKQDQLMKMGMNELAGLVNYLLLLIQQRQNENGKDFADEDSLPPNTMLLEFLDLVDLGPNSPYIAQIPIIQDQ